jgi:hypothetical protein
MNSIDILLQINLHEKRKLDETGIRRISPFLLNVSPTSCDPWHRAKVIQGIPDGSVIYIDIIFVCVWKSGIAPVPFNRKTSVGFIALHILFVGFVLKKSLIPCFNASHIYQSILIPKNYAPMLKEHIESNHSKPDKEVVFTCLHLVPMFIFGSPMVPKNGSHSLVPDPWAIHGPHP